MSKFKGKSCIYCGSTIDITADHVPPKNIFPAPRPGNLITVPSCKRCNEKAGKDDEYFRLTLSIRNDIFTHKEVQRNWKKVKRSLSRKEGSGFKTQLINNIKILDVHTAAGIYLGKVPGYDVDLLRINSVVERIMKGVFYRHKKYPLPNNIKAKAYSVQDMQVKDNETVRLFEAMMGFVTVEPLNSFGNDIFNYKVRFLEERPNLGIFLTSFYHKAFFFGLFVDKQE